MSEPKYELIVYGATGFTGRLIVAYLDGHPHLEGRRWAMAGRNQSVLEVLRKTLESDNIDTITCALSDSKSVNALVSSTKVVITTAGPFSAYDGEKLLGACAKTGTHYSDLSGESFWQREMIEQFHEEAKASGAKIILGGGVDSIPSDIGAHLALKELGTSIDADEAVTVSGIYSEYSGSFSGGTMASVKAIGKALRTGRLTEEVSNHPYILAPGVKTLSCETATADGMPKDFRFQFDGAHVMLFPFFMGKINAPIVRRSLFLNGKTDTTKYRECSSLSMWLRIAWLYFSRGMGYLLGDPIKFNPKPGEGPPTWMIKQGAFAIHVNAKAESGKSAQVVISGKGDPGYGATSKMLAEVGLCLAQRKDMPKITGVLTPAIGLGDALVAQLDNADDGNFMSFKITGVS